MKLAVQHNIRFLATGGRHGFGLGYGTLKEGMSIDLSLFKGFTADPASATVTIGGAATVAEFHDQLYDSGLMLPSGSCSCPGYLGLGIVTSATFQAVAALGAGFSAYPWRDTKEFYTFSATLDDVALAAN
jgi:hypothetical protein